MLNAESVQLRLTELNATQTDYATQFVNQLLDAAQGAGVSDIHLVPDEQSLVVRWRLDGVLQLVGRFPVGEQSDVISRLKVMAQLLTYRTETPQEGRIRPQASDVEMRVSTFPTLYGERAVVRLFASEGRFLYPDDLGLPAELKNRIKELLSETSGAIVVIDFGQRISRTTSAAIDGGELPKHL